MTVDLKMFLLCFCAVSLYIGGADKALVSFALILKNHLIAAD